MRYEKTNDVWTRVAEEVTEEVDDKTLLKRYAGFVRREKMLVEELEECREEIAFLKTAVEDVITTHTDKATEALAKASENADNLEVLNALRLSL